MSKHTPGPWFWTSNGEIKSETTNSVVIRSVNHCDPLGASDEKTRAADARLIAAAPQLLEALQDMVSDHADLSPGTLSFARAAIAAAKGTP